MDSKEFKQYLEKIERTFNEFREANDKRLEALEKNGHAPADREEKTDRINEAIESLTERLEKMEAAAQRLPSPSASGDEEKAEKIAAYKSALRAGLKRGALTEEEKAAFLAVQPESRKALATDSLPDGGFLVRPEFENEFVRIVHETSPMEQIARVRTIGTDEFKKPVNFDEPEAGWVGERQSRTAQDTPELDQLRISVHEVFTLLPSTQKMLEDGEMDVEQFLIDEGADKMRRVENAGFVTGNGVLKPRGFTTYADGNSYGQVEQITSGVSGDITADKLIDIQEALKDEYHQNGTWVMPRAMRKLIRKLKDGNGQYLLPASSGLENGKPMMLLERPIVIFEDMADPGAGTISIGYGDFRRGYTILRRRGVMVLRDPYSDKPNVQFYMTKRVGGGVENSEAIKLGKLSA